MSQTKKKRLAWGSLFAAVVIVLSSIGWQLSPTTANIAQAVEGGSTAPTAQASAVLSGQLAVAADLSEAFHHVAEKLQPSVVRISSVTRLQQTRGDGRRQFGPQLPEGIPDEFRRFFNDDLGGRLNPRQFKQEGLGSGVVVSSDGYILTNNHVVRGADEVKVNTSDHREFRAKIVGGDPKTDLAVLKIDAKNLPYATLGNSDDMKVGQWVLAIGCPFGLEQTVTAGIISARGRVVGIIEEGYEDFLQTDAAINPGNSGGPLVNLRGEVVGINAAIESRTGGNMGIGFAIPTNLARNVMDSLIKDGKVVRGWLGAAIQELDSGLAESFSFQGKHGVLIGSVMPNSPAEKAGLKEGDIVTELNGRPLETRSQLRNGVAALAPKSKADLTVFRNGKTQHLQVVVGELVVKEDGNQSTSEEVTSTGELGLTVQPLTRQLAEEIGHKGELTGVVVTNVESGSLAEQATIRPGDVILAIGSTPVKNATDYRDAIGKFDPKKGIRMQLLREGIRLYVFVKSAE